MVSSPSCPHVFQVSDDWPPSDDPVCLPCVEAGSRWVSLRRCLSCGTVGCCDSSPNQHATAHHRSTGHPVIRSLQPGQDWVWCYYDEVTLRQEGDLWRELDLFYEVGLGYMKKYVNDGGAVGAVSDDSIAGHGFPLGAWVGEMRRRHRTGELSADQAAALEELPGWHWNG